MSSFSSAIQRVKPRPLKPGDTFGIVSTSFPTTEPSDAFEQGIALLEAAGFRAKLLPHAQSKHGYMAGTDTERLSDLHAAFADPDIHGILCARGGYGAMRLLPDINYSLIQTNPKAFIGFSDLTVLLNTFYQRCGLVGFYGPMLTSNLLNNEPYSQAELFHLIGGRIDFPYLIPNRDPYTCFHAGTAEGPLVGGNLSLLAALCGTPYQVNTDGAILFIEDWKEQYYSLDRQFQQLKLAGMFNNIAGLLLCDFSEIIPEPAWNLTEQLQRLTADLTVPVGYGFSVGHGEQTATLPIGINARFDADTGTLTLLESPIE